MKLVITKFGLNSPISWGVSFDLYCRVFLSYTRDRRLKVSSERLGNEDKEPCPRALLPGWGSNRGPPVWKSEYGREGVMRLGRHMHMVYIRAPAVFSRNQTSAPQSSAGAKIGIDLDFSLTWSWSWALMYKVYGPNSQRCFIWNLWLI